MSERSLQAFEEARRKLVEPDPAKVGRGVPLRSIKDATWVHQKHALVQGYNNVLEMAFDELAAEIAELKARIDALEAQLDAGG